MPVKQETSKGVKRPHPSDATAEVPKVATRSVGWVVILSVWLLTFNSHRYEYIVPLGLLYDMGVKFLCKKISLGLPW